MIRIVQKHKKNKTQGIEIAAESMPATAHASSGELLQDLWVGDFFQFSSMVISTRRFLDLPVSVVLSAIGRSAP